KSKLTGTISGCTDPSDDPAAVVILAIRCDFNYSSSFSDNIILTIIEYLMLSIYIFQEVTDILSTK
ncbi:MAG TPA: hypothetical protein VK553_11505, partial [Candidatus Nitrosopolaris rasttigaisensis]|nr:hypothetical protein [Candidatus Nitrosopolaris rasttigaisensis]